MSLNGLFFTGTDTGVGKTFVAATVVRLLRASGCRVGAYKPAASGSLEGPAGPVWEDAQRLQEALGGGVPLDAVCPQRFRAPLAPPVAARQEGRTVDSELLRRGADWWSDRADLLVVEGAGGLLSPLTETESVADLARDLGFPLVVVARLGLGTINHTLLTIEAAQRRGLAVAGIVLNQPDPEGADDLACRTNAEEIARRTAAPVLASLPYVAQGGLLGVPAFRKIDWRALAGAAPARPDCGLRGDRRAGT